MSNSDDLFDVTIVPPTAGSAPQPPAELREVFAAFDDIQAEPRHSLQTNLGGALCFGAGLFVGHYAPRAPGLSANEMAFWAHEIRATLSGQQRAQLLEYVERCRYWERALREAIERGEVDWEVEPPSPFAHPSMDDKAMADSLGAAGIPVGIHVWVAEDEVSRRWGDRYPAIVLRWAHRERAYLLRVAIEIDGQYIHVYNLGQDRDQERNQILADRGWYVAKLSGSIEREERQRLTRERLLALVEQHRRAIVLARSDLPALTRNL